MIFSFDSYMINVNTYKTEEFMKKLKAVDDLNLEEKIISTLAKMSIDYKKPHEKTWQGLNFKISRSGRNNLLWRCEDKC